MADCARALEPYVDWSLLGVLRGEPDAPPLDRVDVVQPVLFAVMVSLAALWRSYGVHPDAVAGHSQGEIAAAYVAGALSLDDAARIIALRSRALKSLAGQGAMLSVGMRAGELEPRLAEWGDQLSIAAVNGAGSAVVSGAPGAVDALAGQLTREGVPARKLRVDWASHSPQVEAVREDLLDLLAPVRPRAGEVPLYSAVTGRSMDGSELGAEYWYRNLRQVVRFQEATEALAHDGHRLFVEVGPHPAVSVAVQETLDELEVADAVVVGSLRRGEGGMDRFLTSVARLFVSGGVVDWSGATGLGTAGDGAVDLPTYAFERERFWLAAGPDVVYATPETQASTGTGTEELWEAVGRADAVGVAELLGVGVGASLESVVPALGVWWRRCRERGVVDGWRYGEVWKPVGGGDGGVLSGCWLVVVPGVTSGVGGALGGAGGAVVEGLERAGARVVGVQVEVGEGCVDREVLAGLLGEAVGAGGDDGVSGVVLLVGVGDGCGVGGGVPGGWPGELVLGVVQGLGDVGVEVPLWCVTSGAVSVGVGDGVVCAGLGQVWGLGRVVGLELPEVWGGLVDVPGVVDGRVVEGLVGVLGGGERECAVRASGVFVRRVVRAPLGGVVSGRVWEPHGTVLITGNDDGRDQPGAHTALWAAARGASHLLLINESGNGFGLLEELAGLGVGVTVGACDVGDREALGELLAGVPEEFPLCGVVHAAGVLDDGVLGSLSPGRLAGVRRAKAVGAWNLHELTRCADLSAFVVFSSAAGSWGAPGQGNYAAANAEVDALVRYRRHLGLPGLSVAWGAWAGEGMAGDAEVAGQLRRRGMAAMDPQLALEALGQALDHDDTCVTVTDIDWKRFAENTGITGLSPVISDIPEVQSLRADTGDTTRGALRDQLARLDGIAARTEALRELVRSHAAAVLGHSTAQDVPSDRAFRDLGFSSLTAVELRNRLGAVTGLRLPTTLVFDHPTSFVLAEYLHEQMFGDGRAVTSPAPTAHHVVGVDEPVAIVGMACRFPGDVGSPEEFWDLLMSGRDAVSGFPVDRGWDAERLFDPDVDSGRAGVSYACEGGFLHDAADFDAAFFGISPREALAMDPQQRLMLEASWEALERAGIEPGSLRGSQTGVFAGMSQQDYAELMRHSRQDLEGYAMTGVSGSVLSGRISYTFGLEGPAVTVETACSSSLVALHLASQSLRAGECSLALVGGATVLSTPAAFLEFSRQRGLAPDGRCKAFAAAADGVGWGEGVGVLLVERLSDARRLGHQVLAVVRGSAVNQDGASNGLTAPSGPSQQRVIRQALANARLTPADVDAVEAHGTGTTLGDPIEAQALLATYGQGRPGDQPLWLGSAKSNIGHTQAAAGVAGVIKMVLALRNGTLPRTLHIDEPSPHIDWDAGAVRLLTEEMPWPGEDGRPRRAGVSSFGVSGTNAHVILEQAPEPATSENPTSVTDLPEQAAPTGPQEDSPATPHPLPWTLSARSESALRGQARSMRQFARANGNLDLAAVAHALVTERSLFEHRAVVLGTDRDDFLRGLDALASGTPAPGLVEGPDRATPDSPFAMLFAGQGTQRAGMGRELYAAFPGYAEALDAVLAELDSHLDRPLGDLIFDRSPGTGAAAEELDRTCYAQPALFAVEVALFRLVESFGVRPRFVLGHSVGELAAAHVAGVFSLADAARLVAARGRLMQELPSGGAMTAIRATESEVTQALEGLAERVSLAAVNGPESVVISGDADAVEEVAAGFAGRGRKTRRLRVSHAFHSPLMEPMLADFARVAGSVTYTEPSIGVVSDLTGALAGPGLLTTPDYWVRHVREAVRFGDGVAWLRTRGVRAFLELGPDGTLSALAEDCRPVTTANTGTDIPADTGPTAVTVPALRPDRDEARTLLAALARLHAGGVTVDWPAVIGPAPAAHRVPLPTYAFDRRRYWLDTQVSGDDLAAAGLDTADHPLLGSAVELADSHDLLFTGRLSLRTHPWLADHAVFGAVLLPGTAILELALRAGQEAGLGSVEELALQVPLLLPERGSVVLQLAVAAPGPSGERAFALHSHPDDAGALSAEKAWTCHATGVLAPDALTAQGASGRREPEDETWPPAGAEPVDLRTWYADLAGAGLAYGPAFQGLRAAWRHGEDIYAEVGLGEEQKEQAARYAVHPALLDAALHPVVLRVGAEAGTGEEGHGLLPFSWSGVTVAATGASSLRVRLSPTPQDTLTLRATDPAGRLVVSARSLTFRPITTEQLRAARTTYHDSLFRMEWRPRPLPNGRSGGRSASSCRWALVGPGTPGLGEALDAAGAAWSVYPDLAALGEAVTSGSPPPDMVVVSCGADEAGHAAGSGTTVPGWDGAPAPETPSHPDTEGAPAPRPVPGHDSADAVRQAANTTLELLQRWLVDDRFAESRLAVVTHGAIAATEGDNVPGLTHATVWGLVRSAQSENPDRFVLADTDSSHASRRLLPDALLTGEPQFAVREGTPYVPRLSRVAVSGQPPEAADGDAEPRWDPEGTVLITGGTGVLGKLVARHLVTAHGVRHLLLAGRRGPAAEGAAELVAELAAHGAEATVHACDLANRRAVADLLSHVPPRHPLRAVVHLAGVVDDGILTSLTPERMEAVLGAKALGALHLHELTRDLDLRDFLVFSSAAASFGSPGQGNYTAANAFLDALAHHRRARGLPGQALAWGLWAEASGMTGHLEATDLARMSRGGLTPLSNEQGLALIDAAGTVDEPLLLTTRLDVRTLYAQAAAGALPRILQGLVKVPARRAAGDGTDPGEAAVLRERLSKADGPGERTGILEELVRAQAALVLGHGATDQVTSDSEFRELGFDSLTAVELRNRLNALTGLRLATTLVFDHPTPGVLARHLQEQLATATDDQDRATAGTTQERAGDPGEGESAARRKYGPSHPGGPSEATVESLFWLGHDTGRVKESMDLLSAASVFRPGFDQLPAEAAPRPVRLAQGPGPLLICLPTVAAVSSAYQYARFAAALEGLRDVWYVPAPGFVTGELLPNSVEVVTRTFADIIVAFADGAPFALAGHSAGGWLTYAVTRYLEDRGVFPEAAVAMDAYLPDEGMAPVAGALTSEIFDRVTEFVDVDYTRLTAMGAYFRIFSGWRPPEIVTPALFLRGRDGEQQPPVWGTPHTVHDIEGNHFTMLEGYAEGTARYVHAWLTGLTDRNEGTDEGQ
ncbi:hypothetical protein GCM10009544_55690 [Streptomyces stramineus]|uniref:Polyketide synthase n=4 Tax=Streptomyces stramineus TaxID=173861 RepID=A0ABN1AZL8_9ACTN